MSIDARITHPFTSIIDGPSQSGKSTFLRNLLLRAKEFIDTEFDYIFIFMGTSAHANPVLCEIEKAYPDKTLVFEIPTLFGDKFAENFPPYFMKLLKEQKGKNGCVIFDDLMHEFSQCKMLVDVFTKISSHNKVSVFYITQNLFAKGIGSTNVTLYRNTHVLVHFNAALDKTPTRIIAMRLAGGKNKDLGNMLENVIQKHRYVVIRGQNADPRLKYTSDIFAYLPGTKIPFFRSFSLDKEDDTLILPRQFAS